MAKGKPLAIHELQCAQCGHEWKTARKPGVTPFVWLCWKCQREKDEWYDATKNSQDVKIDVDVNEIHKSDRW